MSGATWRGARVETLTRDEAVAALAQIATWTEKLELTQLRSPQLSTTDPEASRMFWERAR